MVINASDVYSPMKEFVTCLSRDESGKDERNSFEKEKKRPVAAAGEDTTREQLKLFTHNKFIYENVWRIISFERRGRH